MDMKNIDIDDIRDMMSTNADDSVIQSMLNRMRGQHANIEMVPGNMTHQMDGDMDCMGMCPGEHTVNSTGPMMNARQRQENMDNMSGMMQDILTDGPMFNDELVPNWDSQGFNPSTTYKLYDYNDFQPFRLHGA